MYVYVVTKGRLCTMNRCIRTIFMTSMLINVCMYVCMLIPLALCCSSPLLSRYMWVIPRWTPPGTYVNVREMYVYVYGPNRIYLLYVCMYFCVKVVQLQESISVSFHLCIGQPYFMNKMFCTYIQTYIVVVELVRLCSVNHHGHHPALLQTQRRVQIHPTYIHICIQTISGEKISNPHIN